VALVFVPLLTRSGEAERPFAPLGSTCISAILASLAVAVTVTPALCALLLGDAALPSGEPPVGRLLLRRYRALLERVCRRPRATLLASGPGCAAGFGALPGLRCEFLPPLRAGHYIMHATG
jgi:Cu/Ag efflux pump CusA